MKIIRNVYTTDAPIGWLAPTRRQARNAARDALLEAVPVGKVLVSGLTWEGDLKPHLDRHLDMVEAFTTPFTLNRLLHAEPAPEVLRMGRTWVGDLIRRFDALANDDRAKGTADKVDLAAVRQGLDLFHRSLGTEPFDARAYEEALLAARDAAAAVRTNKPSGTQDAWTQRHPEAARIAAMNDANREYWASGSQATFDSVGAVRDAVHAAHRATNMRDKIQAMQAANNAFWVDRSNPAAVRDGFHAPRTLHPIERHAQTSPADLNARNRGFWSQR